MRYGYVGITLKGARMKLKRYLILPDTHVPYHNKKAFQLAIEVAKKLDVSGVVIIGDFADFYSINRYGKHPKIQDLLMDEVVEVVEALEYIGRMLPKAHKVFIEGNHEHRLSRYIQDNAPALFGVCDVKGFFELKRLGWEFVKYGPRQAYQVPGTNLFLRHEPQKGGDNFLINSLKTSFVSIGVGHNHIAKMDSVKTLDGRIMKAFSVGCLAAWDEYPEIFNYVKNHHQWDLGFSILEVHPSDKDGWRQEFIRVDPVRFSCHYGTQEYCLGNSGYSGAQKRKSPEQLQLLNPPEK